MDYHDYNQRVQDAAARERAGDHAGAKAMFTALAEDSSLPDMDRNIMYYNAALLSEGTGTAEETGRLYDRAIDLERRWCCARAREGKAGWLERVGRSAEAAAVYRELLDQPWLLLAERRRYEEGVFRTRR